MALGTVGSRAHPATKAKLPTSRHQATSAENLSRQPGLRDHSKGSLPSILPHVATSEDRSWLPFAARTAGAPGDGLPARKLPAPLATTSGQSLSQQYEQLMRNRKLPRRPRPTADGKDASDPIATKSASKFRQGIPEESALSPYHDGPASTSHHRSYV